MTQMKPDREAFNRLAVLIETTNYTLNCKDVCDVFGWPAMELYILITQGESPQAKEITILLHDIKRLLLKQELSISTTSFHNWQTNREAE